MAAYIALRGWEGAATDSTVHVPFECTVLDADEAPLRVQQRWGVVVYVRVISGTLPATLPNILIAPYGWLIARPAKGAFAPVAASLSVPAGRTYAVTMLARLPPLAGMRPYLRGGLHPPTDLDPMAVPVALEGLPDGFRAIAGKLQAASKRRDVVAPTREALAIQLNHIRQAASTRSMALRNHVAQSTTDTAIEQLLEALADEIADVRETAAHALQPFAARLPIAPFLAAIRDKRALNFAWCLAAAFVFAAHPDEVPIEALLDLYHNMSPKQWPRPLVQVVVVRAMGRLGDRAPDEVIDLLASILQERRAIHDIRVRRQAAIALGELGERAPIAALIAGMDDGQPEVAAAAATALLQQSARITEDTRNRAQLMSDVQSARRVIYGKFYPGVDSGQRMGE
jgi:hypothetical protein